MNALSSLAILIVLSASVALSLEPRLHTPGGALLLFAGSLFISLGFLLFGRLRFDELFASPAPEAPAKR
ncbi:conserved hypothetical protein [Pseudomonas sp. 8Z]|uniref:hypothetical protein n=1 Tax=Pseudomonas sp. 8Z TaxID=2653166 RepID=UPI0012F33729|nr:hypothetical protein [Pseudomonas sp. 8Z]VXC66002.1 conserved hypothetical protein [Pseudomonas sp. 8Z]